MGNKHACSLFQMDTISLFARAVRKLAFWSPGRNLYPQRLLPIQLPRNGNLEKNSHCYAHKIGKSSREIGRIMNQLSPTPTLFKNGINRGDIVSQNYSGFKHITQ